MRMKKFSMWNILVLLGLASLSAGCTSAVRPGVAPPDSISGFVIDENTGEGVQGATIAVYINEKYYVESVGPEGVVKPKIRESTGVISAADGSFFIDLTELKKSIRKEYGADELVMSDIHVYKMEYISVFKPYERPGQKIIIRRQGVFSSGD